MFDATTRVHLWSDRFEGSLENICELQDQVASGVVGAVDPKLLEAVMARVKRKPTANPDAYDCFLRASALIHQWQLRAMKSAPLILQGHRVGSGLRASLRLRNLLLLLA